MTNLWDLIATEREMTKRKVVIQMLDDGNSGYIVVWPEHKDMHEGEMRFSPRYYAMSNADDLVKFLDKKLKGELLPSEDC